MDYPLGWPDRRRLRLVAGAGVGGLATGPLVTVAVLVVGRPLISWLETTFAIGGVFFGLGLLGWSGSVMVGRTIERLQVRLGTRTHWTEADSRRAMARLAGFGAGTMVATAVIGVLVA